MQRLLGAGLLALGFVAPAFVTQAFVTPSLADEPIKVTGCVAAGRRSKMSGASDHNRQNVRHNGGKACSDAG